MKFKDKKLNKWLKKTTTLRSKNAPLIKNEDILISLSLLGKTQSSLEPVSFMQQMFIQEEEKKLKNTKMFRAFDGDKNLILAKSKLSLVIAFKFIDNNGNAQDTLLRAGENVQKYI